MMNARAAGHQRTLAAARARARCSIVAIGLMLGARREPSVTPWRPIRSPCIVRLPRRVMFWRSFLPSARRASVALALLLSTLPLATPSLAAELIVDNSDSVVVVKGKWT